MYLMQIYDYKTGVCPTTIQQIQTECGLTRQQVRTAIKNLEKDNILIVVPTLELLKVSEVLGRSVRSPSTLSMSSSRNRKSIWEQA